MKKVYICPETEVVKSHLAEHLLDHSYGDVDARQNSDFFESEDEETLKSRNLWDE